MKWLILAVVVVIAGCAGPVDEPGQEDPAVQGAADPGSEQGVPQDSPEAPPAKSEPGTQDPSLQNPEPVDPQPVHPESPHGNQTPRPALPTQPHIVPDQTVFLRFESHPDGGLAAFPFTVPSDFDDYEIHMEWALVNGTPEQFGVEMFWSDPFYAIARGSSRPYFVGDDYDAMQSTGPRASGSDNIFSWEPETDLRLVTHAFGIAGDEVTVAVRLTVEERTDVADIARANATTYGPSATGAGYHYAAFQESFYTGHSLAWTGLDPEFTPRELHRINPGARDTWDGELKLHVDASWQADMGTGGIYFGGEGGTGAWDFEASIFERSADESGEHVFVPEVGGVDFPWNVAYDTGAGGLSASYTWDSTSRLVDHQVFFLSTAYGVDPQEFFGVDGWTDWDL